MKNIEIDDDVYERLRQQQTTFSGESASEVLRRVLGLIAPPMARPVPDLKSPPAEILKRFDLHQAQSDMRKDGRTQLLWDFVTGPTFAAERNAVGKFLALLSVLHRENGDNFARVQGISGRSRKYFAKSESELDQSGTSIHPKRIPGSDYWVATNNSTQSKVELVLQVMKLLSYDAGFAAFVATHIT